MSSFLTRHPLCVVTATSNLERARPCIESWVKHTSQTLPVLIVVNGYHAGREAIFPDIEKSAYATITRQEYLGSVPAFELGTRLALAGTYEVIACLHDDYEIQEQDWDRKVLRTFRQLPQCGLLGFGGAVGLGAASIYQTPYDPMQLARVGFRSNLVDAEVHGLRSLLSEPVACLDGFSQVGRRAFWEGQGFGEKPGLGVNPWRQLMDLGIVHHLYDSLLGMLAYRYGWQTWYVPLRSTHHGGRTAVGDPGYQDWAKRQIEGGDQGFWARAHQVGYEQFRDILPFRV